MLDKNCSALINVSDIVRSHENEISSMSDHINLSYRCKNQGLTLFIERLRKRMHFEHCLEETCTQWHQYFFHTGAE